MLERAFQIEYGQDPDQEELNRFLYQAEEVEKRAVSAESLAREADQKAEFYRAQDGEDAERLFVEWSTIAYRYYRQAYLLYVEDLRLRQYLKEMGALPAVEKLEHFRQLSQRVESLLGSLARKEAESEQVKELRRRYNPEGDITAENLERSDMDEEAIRQEAEGLHLILNKFLKSF